MMKRFLTLLLSTIVIASCSDSDSNELEPEPDLNDGVEIEIVETDVRNAFIVSTEGVDERYTRWDLGYEDGKLVSGNEVTAEYPYKGEYTISLSYRSPKTYEQLKKSKTITIEEDNLDLVDNIDDLLDPIELLLSGGSKYPDGKVWVMDSTASGHIGNGHVDDNYPSWWAIDPYGKVGTGLYDDQLTFKFDGAFLYENNGITLSQGQESDDLVAMGGVVLNPEDDGDKVVEFTPGTDWKWRFEKDEESGKNYLIFVDDLGFLPFFTGSPQKYEIIEISENKLYARKILSNGYTAWYFKMIQEGYDGTEEPDPEPQPENVYIEDDFEGEIKFLMNIENGGSQSEFGVDNPFKGEGNESDKVVCYHKSDHRYGRFAYYLSDDKVFDLHTFNKIRMKVYMPSSNDYDTENEGESWLPSTKLMPKVAVKFQNSLLGGDAWETEATIGIENIKLDEWVELTFNFETLKDKDKGEYDCIVIQFGNEGHNGTGVFYFDDFIYYGDE